MESELKPEKRKWLPRRIFQYGVLIMISIFVLVYFWFYLFQEVKLFEPHKKPTGYVPKPQLDPSADYFVNIGEAKVNFQKFVARTEPRKGIIVYLHGNRGSIEICRFIIEPFLNAGHDVWTMDYRGFGKSTGRRSEAAMLADAQIVYKRVLQDENEGDIIVWGRSMGSGIAAFIASGNSPKALVLETPYWSLPDAVCHSRPYLFPFLFRYKLPTNEYLGNVDCPVYLIHGTADEKIYFESSKRLEQQCLDLDVEVRFHQIVGGLHNLRSEPKFEAVLNDILK